MNILFRLFDVLNLSSADEERTFLIGEELHFRTGDTEGEPTLIWRDIEGDATEFYEFVARGTNEPTRAFFETCMYRAMYERKYKTSADNTQDKDLAEFIWQYVSPGLCTSLHADLLQQATAPQER